MIVGEGTRGGRERRKEGEGVYIELHVRRQAGSEGQGRSAGE